jgi:hypothetical protein
MGILQAEIIKKSYMILFETHPYAFVKTRMMQFATGPTHENGFAIFMRYVRNPERSS